MKTFKSKILKLTFIEPTPLKNQYSAFNLNNFKRYTNLLTSNDDSNKKSRNVAFLSPNTTITRLEFLISTKNVKEATTLLKTIFSDNILNVDIISCFIYISCNNFSQFMLTLFSVLSKISQENKIPNEDKVREIICKLFIKQIQSSHFNFLAEENTYHNKHKFIISFLVSLLLLSNKAKNFTDVLIESIKSNLCEMNKCDICNFFIMNILKQIIVKYNPLSEEKNKENTKIIPNYYNKSSYLTYLSHINIKKESKKDCIAVTNSNSHSSLAFLSTEKSLNNKIAIKCNSNTTTHSKYSLKKQYSLDSNKNNSSIKIIPSRSNCNISLHKKIFSKKHSGFQRRDVNHYSNISSSISQLDSLILQFKTDTEKIKNQIN